MKKISLGLILFVLCLGILVPQFGSEPELEDILKKGAEYCERLANSVLYFVCLEKVKEDIYRLGHSTRLESWNTALEEVRNRDLGINARIGTRKTKTHKCVYDYQLMRKDNEIKEVRQLIREDGKKLKPKYSELENLRFRHENLIMGPIGLLSEFWQNYNDYEIVDRKKYKGEKAIILQVTPKPGFGLTHLFGKVWIRASDCSVLKIEWSQKGIKGYGILEEIAKAVQMEPRIALCTEYGYEKNGLRFPSKFTLEETYVSSEIRKFTKSTKVVEYEDYKFFTVETEVKHQP